MPTPSHKTVIIIAGATASGKTAVAIDVARHFKTEIISADSRQCYRELDIGVARPAPQELAAVPQHFIATHSIHEEVTAASFERYALEKASELFSKHSTIVLCGGTGLYIRAFCEGLDAIPSIDAGLRQSLQLQYEAKGIAWLQEELRLKDPRFFSEGEIMNPQRSMRALEVVLSTNRSILSFHQGVKAERPFQVKLFGLEWPRPELYARINTRVDEMMKRGLLEEVKSLWSQRHLNALQTVGYAELFDHLEGKTSLEEAVELIKQHTRQYAKRQMTWFKRVPSITWISAGPAASTVQQIVECAAR